MIGPFKGNYAFLSNFYPSKVYCYDIEFSSVENAYQASKTFDINLREQISLMSAREAKKFGRTVELTHNWESQKIEIMEELVRRKFFGNKRLAELLISTGEEELVEVNTWGDCFWGEYEGFGLNHLGKILMKVREEVKSMPTYYWN